MDILKRQPRKGGGASCALPAPSASTTRILPFREPGSTEPGPSVLHLLQVLIDAVNQQNAILAGMGQSLASIANPHVPDKVGTPYVAKRLGQTTTWVAEMARRGDIPKTCVVAGTGTGKPWKFHRNQIDEWIEQR